MGNQVTVGILTDHLHEIEANPERFVKELCEAIYSRKEQLILGQTTVLPAHHADNIEIIVSRHNSLTNLFPRYYSETLHSIRYRWELIGQVKKYLPMAKQSLRTCFAEKINADPKSNRVTKVLREKV